MKQLTIEIPEGKQATWQEINGLQTLVLIDEQPSLDNWQDPDIYPVWRDESQPKTLDNLRGIRVPCLDGSEFLYYPKRATLKLLSDDADVSGIEIQKNPFYPTVDQHTLTTQWLNAGSEAARFVRSFGEDKSLPTMLQLIAIEYYAEQIDKIAELLDGDLISDDDTVSRWSCCRCYTTYAWSYISYGVSSNYAFFNSFRVSVVSAFAK